MNPERYTSPEHEVSSERNKDEPEDSKKKKKKQAADLGKVIAGDKAEAEKPVDDKDGGKDPRSVWQKLLGEEPVKEKPDPETDAKQGAGEVNVEESETDENNQQLQHEFTEDLEKSDDNPELENLSEDEQLAVARFYVQTRLEELEASEDESAEPAEQLERLTLQDFLNTLKGRLDSFEPDVPDKSVEGPVNEAFRDSTAHLSVTENFNLEPAELENEPEQAPLHDDRQRRAQEFLPDQPVSVANRVSSIPESKVIGKSSSQEMISHDESMSREAHAQAKGVVAGALVGYLLGRRRGRIKTEKRFKTVQSKLEKQVGQVQSQIAAKEQDIKRLTRRQQEMAPVAVAAGTTLGMSEAAQPRKPEIQSERPFNQTPALNKNEKPVQKTNYETGAAPTETPAAVESNHQQLIEKSAKIKIGETNLRRVWESRLVDEKGLKRLIAEHEAGRDIRRALASEFLAKELRFERDPYLRDQLSAEVAGLAGGGKHISEQSQSTSSDGRPANKAPTTSSVVAANNAKKASKKYRQPATISPLLLFGLTLITILLALYAVWLTFTR